MYEVDHTITVCSEHITVMDQTTLQVRSQLRLSFLFFFLGTDETHGHTNVHIMIHPLQSENYIHYKMNIKRLKYE